MKEKSMIWNALGQLLRLLGTLCLVALWTVTRILESLLHALNSLLDTILHHENK